MRTDIDTLLLDRLFQPLADRLAGLTNCFGLARLSLAAAVLLQFAVLAADLTELGAPSQRLAAAAIALLALFGAEQGWRLIVRTERQARSGGMNLRRITLRWQRLAWLGVTSWSVVGAGGNGLSEAALWGACVAWVGLIYFVSCTPTPPPMRVGRNSVFA